MSSLVFENGRFVYDGDSGKKVLLDCNKLLENKSRVPFHSVDDSLTVPSLLLDLMNEHPKICEGTEQQAWGIYYVLVDILTAAYHVKSAAQKNVLELGCTGGIMSWHLATLLGKLHPGSLLYSVSDTIGNDSDNHWLEYIMQVGQLPRMAFAAVDYDGTCLQEDSFDITVINGSVPMNPPDQVIREAVRVTKKDGLIICMTQHQPLLESTFQLLLPEREEYFFHYEGRVLAAYKQ